VLAAEPTVVVHVSGAGWPTLALALIGVLLSLLALAWQAYSFAVSGSRIRVELRRCLGGDGAVATFPDDAPAWHFEQAAGQGLTEPLYAVKVNNSGRGGTSITGIELAFSDGGAVVLTGPDPPLPFRLDGEHEQTWYVEAGLAGAYASTSAQVWPEKAKDMTVQGRVTLGSSKTVSSRNRLRVV
jgi:hypothetical protein